ncbi:MAG: hypothetical protein AAB197_07170 [Deltaproteobacteria bacterium]
MHKTIKIFFVCLLFVFSVARANTGQAEDGAYYARCNLKVLKGNKITWVNWQSSPSMVPAGTKLKVTKGDGEATLVDAKTNTSYSLDIGASGDQFLEKFVTKKPVDISNLPANIQKDIKKGIPRNDMTKEQVYIAMGPPAYIDGKNKTDNATYENIMAANLWVYERRRLGKRIGIEFDASSGLVSRTEGVWGK